MDSMNFRQKSPILYKIVSDLKKDGEEFVTWQKFAFKVNDGICNRKTDKGLERIYKLLITAKFSLSLYILFTSYCFFQ